MTIQDKAKQALAYLYRGEREADGIGCIILPRTGAPQWFTDLCREAHGDMLPDDWRYEFIQDALNHIEEAEGEPEESFSESFDGRYAYTHQATAWLASHLSRLEIAEEARTDCGGSLAIMGCLQLGMLREAEEVFYNVLGSLRDLEDGEEC